MTDQLIDNRQHKFIIVDNSIIERISEIGPYAFAVYCALAMHFDNTGIRILEIKRVAEITGMSRQNVENQIVKLKRAKLVTDDKGH